jgi:hypothetical protein
MVSAVKIKKNFTLSQNDVKKIIIIIFTVHDYFFNIKQILKHILKIVLKVKTNSTLV